MNDDAAPRWDGYLGPRVWAPLAVIAVAAIVGLAIFAFVSASDRNGNGSGGGLGFGQCEPGDTSCTLRQAVHWHADFALIINGERFDFNDPAFISTAEFETSVSSHIHNPRHSVVHLHYEQTTWAEFFDGLGFALGDGTMTMPDGTVHANDDTNRWTYLVNGVEIDRLRLQYISDLDRVILNYGPETAEELLGEWETLVGDEACIPSGLCEARFPPGGVEEEPCSVGSGTCN